MSDIVSIDIVFGEPISPKVIFQFLLDSGWQVGRDENYVIFIPPGVATKDAGYKRVTRKDFSAEKFIESHTSEDSIEINLRNGDLYGTFHIDKQSLWIMFGDVVRLDIETSLYRPVPDFSWYLKRLIPLLEYTKSHEYSCDVDIES